MSANFKPVRPFNFNGVNLEPDQQFLHWFKKNWTFRSVEIGCGAGLHPIQLAKSNKKIGHIALERTKHKFLSFKQRVKNHKLANLWDVNADAHQWLPVNIPKESIDQYFLLYPNPYPKEKQANKRWHRSPFFHFILNSLKARGKIAFATNEAWLAEEFLNYNDRFWKLNIIHAEILTTENTNKPRTHFEKKYLASGQVCYDILCQKS